MAWLLAIESVARGSSCCALAGGAGREDESGDGAELAFRSSDQAAVGLVADCQNLIEHFGPPAALAVATGPGSFTGLRIGVTAARTFAACYDLPLAAVPTCAALAHAAGVGTWWTLLALKKDTTFHACYAVSDDAVTCLQPATPAADASPPERPPPADAVAIGPALAAKPALLASWAPDQPLGSNAALDARAVAAAARYFPPADWRNCLPDYFIKSAPELQRAAGRG